MALNTLQITNGKLTLIVRPDMIPRAQQRAMEIAKSIQKDGKEGFNCTPQQVIEATNRLIALVENIMNSYPKFNIFEYLPVTKSGDFAKGQSIYLADSGITNSWNGDYFSQQRLQLRAEKTYATEKDWFLEKPMLNTLELNIGLATPSKKQPIFDKNGIPTKIETSKSTYLKDSEVLPGSVYMEKGGTEYLYLGSSWSTYKVALPGEEQQVEQALLNQAIENAKYRKANNYIRHEYIRFTKKYQTLASKCKTWQEFMYAIFKQNIDKGEEPYHGFSSRENPRKFVSKSQTLYTDITFNPSILYGKEKEKWLAGTHVGNGTEIFVVSIIY